MSRKDDVAKLIECYQVGKLSRDPSTRNGAIITVGGKVLAHACNDLPEGVVDRPEYWVRPLKYAVVDHAETGVIHRAARVGYPTKGATLYASWAACIRCAGAIINAKIARLVRHKHPMHAARQDWLPEILVADQMLKDAGVEIVDIEQKLGVSFLFNGQVVEA